MKNVKTGKRASHASGKKTRRLDYAAMRISSKNSRKVIVFLSLVGVLSLTSVLLIAMAPDPMRPDAANSLFAVDTPSTLDTIFDTRTPLRSENWKFIFIHHSKTLAGNAQTLGQAARSSEGMGDHFLIGNGDGCVDGEIQESQRWNQQLPAAPPVGAVSLDPACISICLIGDFDHSEPSPTQLRRLSQLIETLQARCRIPASHVVWIADGRSNPAEIGSHFPTADFARQLVNPPSVSRN